MSLPDFMQNYFNKLAEKYISATPSNNIEIDMDSFPLNKGKSYYEQVIKDSSKVYWSGAGWLTGDLMAAENYNQSKKIKNLDKNDFQIIQDLVGEIKGSLNFNQISSKIVNIQNKFFEEKKDIDESYMKKINVMLDSDKEDGEKNKEKKRLTDEQAKKVEDLYQESLKQIANSTKYDESALKSRIDALSKIYDKLGKDIASEVKSVVLGKSNKEDILKDLKSKVVLKAPASEKQEPDYIPEKNENKKEFNKKDQYFVLKQIIEHKESGLQGILKKLRSFYNETLLNELLLASRYFGGLEGIIKYIENYEANRARLFALGQEFDTPSDIKGITQHSNSIRSFLVDLKKEHKTDYIGSVYEELEDAVDIIQKYQRSRQRDLEFENELLNLFGADGKLLKRLRKTKLPVITDVEKLLGELTAFFNSSKKFEESLEKSQKIKNKKEQDKGDSDYLKSIKKMINESSEDLSQEDEKISKKFFDTYKENLKKLRDLDLSEQEILQRKKDFEDYMSERNKIKEWVQMTPEERLEFDKSEASVAKLRERIKNDYTKYWSKLSPTERDQWVKDNNLTADYVKALNEYGAQLQSISKQKVKAPSTKKKPGPKKQIVLSPEEQEALNELKQKGLEKQVKSSYIIEKIEKTSSLVKDPIVSAELYDIVKELKKLI